MAEFYNNYNDKEDPPFLVQNGMTDIAVGEKVAGEAWRIAEMMDREEPVPSMCPMSTYGLACIARHYLHLTKRGAALADVRRAFGKAVVRVFADIAYTGGHVTHYAFPEPQQAKQKVRKCVVYGNIIPQASMDEDLGLGALAGFLLEALGAPSSFWDPSRMPAASAVLGGAAGGQGTQLQDQARHWDAVLTAIDRNKNVTREQLFTFTSAAHSRRILERFQEME